MPFPFLPGEIPPAEKFGEFDGYDPDIIGTTTSPNLGDDGEATGMWVRVGPRLVAGWTNFLFAGSGISAGSGNFEFTLPLPADMSLMAGSAVAGAGFMLAAGFIRDDSAASNNRIVQPQLLDATHFTLRLDASAGRVSATTIAWASGDRIAASFFYIPEPGT